MLGMLIGLQKWEMFLFRYGFGFVWSCREVDNIDLFISFFKQRLCGNLKQQWSADINVFSSCRYHKQYKFFIEYRIKFFIHLKRALSRFRCNIYLN